MIDYLYICLLSMISHYVIRIYRRALRLSYARMSRSHAPWQLANEISGSARRL